MEHSTRRRSASRQSGVAAAATGTHDHTPLAGVQERAGNAATVALLGAQARLKVGRVDDPAEREADRMAAQAMRSLAAPMSSAAQVERSASHLAGVGSPAAVRRRAGEGGGEGEPAPADLQRDLQAAGGGRSLPDGVRAPMERAFGADFSDVKVHDDARAHALNGSLGAEAFAKGSDLYFSPGAYDPASASGKELLAHELAHTVQQDQSVRRRGLSGGLSKEEFLTAMDTPGNRQLLDHIPSTGLGRFDAEYLPRAGELRITVKMYLEFCQTVHAGTVTPGGWDAAEEQAFFDAFKAQAEAAWSSKHTLSCTKPGWEDLTADVVIDVQRAAKPADAHSHARIQKDKDTSTGWGREQTHQEEDGDRIINIGNFAEADAPVRAHDSDTTRGCMVEHDFLRLQRLLDVYAPTPIRFEGVTKTTITKRSKGMLDRFAKGVADTERPGSVPLPVVAVAKENRRERFGPGNPAKDRAKAVQTYLAGKGMTNPVELASFTQLVADAKTKEKNANRAENKAIAKAEHEELKGRQNHREVELEPMSPTDFTWKGDPYSILAHEFGHMLGNPDEYFSYGSDAIKDKKAEQLLATGRPEDALLAASIQGQTASGNESHATVQEAFGDMAEASGQQIPEFGPKTSSIMSAGDEVMPVHYAPLWEVLSEITDKAIRPDEWKIG